MSIESIKAKIIPASLTEQEAVILKTNFATILDDMIKKMLGDNHSVNLLAMDPRDSNDITKTNSFSVTITKAGTEGTQPVTGTPGDFGINQGNTKTLIKNFEDKKGGRKRSRRKQKKRKGRYTRK